MSYPTLLSIHLLAATIWTGGHLVLFFAILIPTLRDRDLQRISAFEQRYERIGIPALIILVATGILLAWIQLPSAGMWFNGISTLSRTLLAKLLLLLSTLLLAVHARFRIIPRLSDEKLGSLAVHIGMVTVLACLLALTGLLHRFGGIW